MRTRPEAVSPPSPFLTELARLIPDGAPVPVSGALERVLLLHRLNGLYESVRHAPGPQPFWEKLLAALHIRLHLDCADRARIPAKGPVVVVANHPFGMLEGAVLAAVLSRARLDIKLMANQILASIPEMSGHVIPVDPFGGSHAKRSNFRGLKETIRWLERDGMVVVFPAGEVSHLDLHRRSITDPTWSSTIGRIVRLSGASVLPVYFRGVNGPLFHLAGMIHPRLRTAMLPMELLNKHNKTLRIFIGSLIAPKAMVDMRSDEEVIGYLRRRTYLLENRESGNRLPVSLPSLRPPRRPLAPAVDSALLASDVAALGPESCLVSAAEFDVYLGSMPQLPNVMREIARLRELTFRRAGEGTGKPLDTDAFDAHYLHLFIWNRQKGEIVGAYRLGATDWIRSRFGRRGLYTSSLFHYSETFLDRLGEALEIGRSFVRPEYQKSYSPLLLLWKGIAAYLVRHPRYKVLFGPVSISNEYCRASRQLIVNVLSQQGACTGMATLVKPKTPFRPAPVKGWAGGPSDWITCSLDELSTLVADMESDQKGVPVLVRQYLKLGGRFAGFNIDRAFSSALDGLIIVDLRQTEAKVLERYMGKDGYAAFLASGRAAPALPDALAAYRASENPADISV